MEKHFGSSRPVQGCFVSLQQLPGERHRALGAEKHCAEYEGVFDMSKELLGVFALGLMVIGEFCAIYSEVVTARLAHAGDGSPSFQPNPTDKEKPAMGSAGLKGFTRSWDHPRRPTVKGM